MVISYILNNKKWPTKIKCLKIGQFGTLTCSPVSPESGTTMPENQGITHFSCQNEVNFYSKFLTSCGIFEIRGKMLNRL